MIWSPSLNKIFSFILWIFFSSVQSYLTWDYIISLVALLRNLSRSLFVFLFLSIMIGCESKLLSPGNTFVVIWLMIFKCPEHILWGSLAFHLWPVIAAITFVIVSLTMIVVLVLFIAVLHCGKHSEKIDVWGSALWAESACHRLASLWEVSNHICSTLILSAANLPFKFLRYINWIV